MCTDKSISGGPRKIAAAEAEGEAKFKAEDKGEDEDDFENTAEDKYVDLQKTVMMECVFSPKYKKWIPRKVVHGQKIVHVSQLTNYY